MNVNRLDETVIFPVQVQRLEERMQQQGEFLSVLQWHHHDLLEDYHRASKQLQSEHWHVENLQRRLAEARDEAAELRKEIELLRLPAVRYYRIPRWIRITFRVVRQLRRGGDVLLPFREE